MSAGKVEIDGSIDYKTFYSRYLENFVPSGDDATGKCPVDGGKSKTAFSVNLKTGTYKCHKCDEKGNAYTFLSWSQGMTEEDARDTVKKLAGVIDMSSRSDKTKRAKITVAGYCEAKKLPKAFVDDLGIKDMRGNYAITIPYMDEAGIAVVTRKRHPIGAGQRFTWVSGAKGKIIPYGVWKLREMGTNPIVFLEGESDCQTLWLRGHETAIGIPGAQMMKQEWVGNYFAETSEILIHVEPGEGGQKFLKKTAAMLLAANFKGIVKAFSTRGAKDPSDLHVAEQAKGDLDDFDTKWKLSLESAQPIEPIDYADMTDATITLPGAPVSLRVPEGFIVNPQGIKLLVEAKGEVGEVSVAPVPILISQRLRSIDTGEEKIELAYQRDGRWHSITTKRSTAFASRAIVELADRGLPITSEKARHVVKYLGDLEAANMDTLPVARSVERMGWVGPRSFIPQLAGDVILDPPEGSEGMANAYHEEGSFDAWKAQADEIRQSHPLARFMLAAALAPVMLRDLRQRVFILHFWGQSRGGKTAAMKLALSAWGEPEALMATFNTTSVGMERMAGFYNDLPMGVDERQVVSSSKGGQGMIEQLVYMLGAGKGRVRGSKGGGLQATQGWRTIVLTSGEEPISRSASHTGVITRALEIWGTPIGNEEAAREVHRTIGRNYGFAGPEFVRKLIAYQDEQGGSIEADYDATVAKIAELAPDHMSSHVSAVAMVTLADAYAGQWIWGETPEQAVTGAYTTALAILSGLETQASSDYTGRAEEWMEGWIAANRDRFADPDHREPWGFERAGVYWIVPSALDEAMLDAGFVPRRVLKDLAERGRLEVDKSAMNGGTIRYKRRQSWRCNRVWMIGYKPERDPVMQAELDSDPAPRRWYSND